MLRVLSLNMLVLFLYSCGNSGKQKILMQAQGMPAEVLIVAASGSDSWLNRALDSGIGGPNKGLIPAEPMYRCALLDPEQAAGDALGASLLVLVKQAEQSNKKLNRLWEEAAEKAEKKSGVLAAKDVWAKNQTVFLLNTPQELHTASLAGLIHASECAQGLMGGLIPNQYSDSVMNRVAGDFGFRFPLPPQFRLVQSNKEMLWFIWEGRDFRANLWVNITPEADSIASLSQMIRIRDTFAHRYVRGNQGWPMMTSKSSEFPSFALPLNQTPGWCGWWTINGQWQRGPFRRFQFADQAGQRTIWLEGFLEAPEIPQSAYYRMFEIIAAGFQWTSNNNTARNP
jgi:hypothetical protein